MNPPHCSACGAPFLTAERTQPHPHCTACDVMNWQNARPVVLLLQPVLVSGGLGLAIARRGIMPDKGGYALPGGFMEKGETSVRTAAREFAEESGVSGLVDFRRCSLLGDAPSSSGEHQLLFVQNNVALAHQDFARLRDTDEMYGWQIRTLISGDRLCWDTHERVVQRWLILNKGSTSMMRSGEVFAPEFSETFGGR